MPLWKNTQAACANIIRNMMMNVVTLEGIAGTACSHEHTDDCYKEVINCTHRHDEDCYPDEIIWDDEATPSDADRWEPEECPHMCEEESECISQKLNCRHKHDDECGYSPLPGNTLRI